MHYYYGKVNTVHYYHGIMERGLIFMERGHWCAWCMVDMLCRVYGGHAVLCAMHHVAKGASPCRGVYVITWTMACGMHEACAIF